MIAKDSERIKHTYKEKGAGKRQRREVEESQDTRG